MSAYVLSSPKDHKDIVYGVVLPPNHDGPRYLDIPFTDMHFPPTLSAMLSTSNGVKIHNAVDGHVVQQNCLPARSLSDADKGTIAEHQDMQSITGNMVIGWNSTLVPEVVIAITTIYIFIKYVKFDLF